MTNLQTERFRRGIRETLDEYEIPEHTRTPLENYLMEGIQPGDFLTHVIENNLIGAMMHADETNLQALPSIVRMFYNEFPEECYGNTKRRRWWCKAGGYAGLLDREAAHA